MPADTMELQRAEEMPETVSKKTRWGLLALMVAVFTAAAIAGNFLPSLG